MPNILSVSDLRNYNEVLKNCQVGEPVFLTKNGKGRFVVMDVEDYERKKAEKKLLMKLQEAEEVVKDESDWMSLDELKRRMSVIVKRSIVVILGLLWGFVSFFWLGYSILSLENLMEEPGSFDYVAEGTEMQIYGLMGCALYAVIFVPILYWLYKRKKSLVIFLLSMIVGGFIPGVYIFVLR